MKNSLPQIAQINADMIPNLRRSEISAVKY